MYLGKYVAMELFKNLVSTHIAKECILISICSCIEKHISQVAIV